MKEKGGTPLTNTTLSLYADVSLYSGQRWRPGGAPCSLWWWGLCHWGAAKGRCWLECQEQAKADSITHSCQQGPPAGGQNPAGLWLPPKPPGIYHYDLFTFWEMLQDMVCDLIEKQYRNSYIQQPCKIWVGFTLIIIHYMVWRYVC